MSAMWERRKPTAAQIDYLRELRAKADTDEAHYLNRRPEDMSRHEVQEEIDRLRYELGEVGDGRLHGVS